MKKNGRHLTYKLLFASKWVIFLVTLILGFAGGLISAGLWSQSGYQYLPPEIVIRPPAPNVIACFPDLGFAGALDFKSELAKQMQTQNLSEFTADAIKSSMRNSMAKNDSSYVLWLVQVRPKHFSVIATQTGGFYPSANLTLVTEAGCYYLHPIPKKRSETYDSLARLWQQAAFPPRSL